MKKLLIVMLLAAPACAQSIAKQGQDQSASTGPSAQAIWDEDASRVQSEIDKLRLNLKEKQFQLQALDALRKNNPAAAEKAAQALQNLDSNSPDGLNYIATAEFEKGNWAGAYGEYNLSIGQWNNWLKSHPNQADQAQGHRQLASIYGNRGASRMMMQDWAGALEDFEQALKLKTPAQALVLWEKAQVLAVQLHEYDKAAKAFEQAAAIDPKIKDEAKKPSSNPSILNLCQTLAQGGQSTASCR